MFLMAHSEAARPIQHAARVCEVGIRRAPCGDAHGHEVDGSLLQLQAQQALRQMRELSRGS